MGTHGNGDDLKTRTKIQRSFPPSHVVVPVLEAFWSIKKEVAS